MECSHRRSLGDPHPLCEPCATKKGFPLCGPMLTCELCVCLSSRTWRRMLDSRRKRRLRSEQATATMSTDTASTESEPEPDTVITFPPRPGPEGAESRVDRNDTLDMSQTQHWPPTQTESPEETSVSGSSDHDEVFIDTVVSVSVPIPTYDSETSTVSFQGPSPDDLETSFQRNLD